MKTHADWNTDLSLAIPEIDYLVTWRLEEFDWPSVDIGWKNQSDQWRLAGCDDNIVVNAFAKLPEPYHG